MQARTQQLYDEGVRRYADPLQTSNMLMRLSSNGDTKSIDAMRIFTYPPHSLSSSRDTIDLRESQIGWGGVV